MFNKCFLASFLALTPIAVNADFLVEFDAGYSFGEITYDPDDSFEETDDYNRYHLDGEIYIGTVDTSNAPFQEAGFLSKKSSVSLSLDRVAYDEEFGGQYDIDSETISGRFVIPGPNIILMASLISEERGDDNKNDANGVGFGIGFYTGDRGALSFEHEKREYEYDTFSDDTETTSRLSYKYVAGSGLRRVAFTVFGERYRYEDTFFSSVSDISSLGGSVKIYVNQRLSIGAGLQLDFYDFSDGDDGFGAIFTPQVTYDFTERFGLYANIHSEAAVYDIDDDDDEVDITTRYFNIGAKIRF